MATSNDPRFFTIEIEGTLLTVNPYDRRDAELLKHWSDDDALSQSDRELIRENLQAGRVGVNKRDSSSIIRALLGARLVRDDVLLQLIEHADVYTSPQHTSRISRRARGPQLIASPGMESLDAILNAPGVSQEVCEAGQKKVSEYRERVTDFLYQRFPRAARPGIG